MPCLLVLHSTEVVRCVLEKCRDAGKLCHMYAYIRRTCSEYHPLLGNIIACKLAKSGILQYAQQVFDKIQCQKGISWNSLIIGYVEHAQPQLALSLYMVHDYLQPNEFAFSALLKACTDLKLLHACFGIHGRMENQGLLERNSYLGSMLINAYVKCGSITKAEQLFDSLSIKNTVSWTALIAGLAKCNKYQEAYKYFERMQREGVPVDATTFVCVLRACSESQMMANGLTVHVEIVKRGLENEAILGNTLVYMYAKWESLIEAEHVFKKLPTRDVVSWNVLIMLYAEQELDDEALTCFMKMQQSGISPTGISFVSVLKVCSKRGVLNQGREIHSLIVKKGLLEKDVFIGSSLVHMYAACGYLTDAKTTFDRLPVQDLVSWNTIIAGQIKHNHDEEALHLFDQMKHKQIVPDIVTYVCALQACKHTGSTESGCKIHGDISFRGLENDISIAICLVDMYAKFGLLYKSEQVLNKVSIRNTVLWNALITGYVEHGYNRKALQCFKRMMYDGICPDNITFISCLKACSNLGVEDEVYKLHYHIIIRGMERDIIVGSTLVDVYSKCGMIAEAEEAFDCISARNVVSWTALIAGYAKCGESKNVIYMIVRMLQEGFIPDLVLLLSILTAFSHAGLVEKSQSCFSGINSVFTPTVKQYSCMVDILGRAGGVENGFEVLQNMPFHPSAAAWHSALGACKVWRSDELGKYAFQNAIAMNEKNAGAYISMSNIYANMY